MVVVPAGVEPDGGGDGDCVGARRRGALPQVRAPAAHQRGHEQELLGDLHDLHPRRQEQQGHHPRRGREEAQDQRWLQWM